MGNNYVVVLIQMKLLHTELLFKQQLLKEWIQQLRMK
jgi:hypothetical protein